MITEQSKPLIGFTCGDINGIGIEPDIKVEMPKDTVKDLQLDKAIDFVKEKMGK